MTALVVQYFVPLLFAGLLFFLLTGIPVAFGLAATGLLFGFIGMEVGLFPDNLFGALPLRVFGIMKNDTLLAIPFFTFMGLILERSGMAEDLLDTIGQLFGPVRGGLAYAVIFVGALLAATTGVVAASVISMGLISLPIMLRYGSDRRIAAGAHVRHHEQRRVARNTVFHPHGAHPRTLRYGRGPARYHRPAFRHHPRRPRLRRDFRGSAAGRDHRRGRRLGYLHGADLAADHAALRL
jgi:hypothetical protein